MILNINEQVKKVLDEIERSTSKGMMFSLDDFISFNLCKQAANFRTFETTLKAKVLNIAYVHNYSDKTYKRK